MDTYIDDNGYERFSDSDYPVHRWVAEKKIGRKLKKGEVIHHKDRDKKNNHPSNLHVFPNQSAHDRVHKYDVYRFGKKASYHGFSPKQESGGCTFIFMLIFIVPCSFFLITCSPPKPFQPHEVYRTETLIVEMISENSYVHTTYKQTNDFGNVPCNGLVVVDSDEAVVFDTPTNDSGAVELIRWIKESLHCQINGVIPTHFHDDCLGGLAAFHQHGIPSYANFKTMELAREDSVEVPQIAFFDSIQLPVGNEYVIARFCGEGHTRDNVVGYFPKEKVLFGGCLIKELDASKGYLGDANTDKWSTTVDSVKHCFREAQLVIPGHGQYGSKELLDYTEKLFNTKYFGE